MLPDLCGYLHPLYLLIGEQRRDGEFRFLQTTSIPRCLLGWSSWTLHSSNLSNILNFLRGHTSDHIRALLVCTFARQRGTILLTSGRLPSRDPTRPTLSTAGDRFEHSALSSASLFIIKFTLHDFTQHLRHVGWCFCSCSGYELHWRALHSAAHAFLQLCFETFQLVHSFGAPIVTHIFASLLHRVGLGHQTRWSPWWRLPSSVRLLPPPKMGTREEEGGKDGRCGGSGPSPSKHGNGAIFVGHHRSGLCCVSATSVKLITVAKHTHVLSYPSLKRGRHSRT